MQWFIQALKDYPELALFLTLAVGYNVGPGFFKGLKKDGVPQVIFPLCHST